MVSFVVSIGVYYYLILFFSMIWHVYIHIYNKNNILLQYIISDIII